MSVFPSLGIPAADGVVSKSITVGKMSRKGRGGRYFVGAVFPRA